MAELKRAEVVAEDEQIANRFRDYLEGLDYSVQIKDHVEPANPLDVDLIVYHVAPEAMRAERRQKVRPQARTRERPRFWLEAVQQISERAPEVPILVAVPPGEDASDRALDSGATDVIAETVTPKMFRRRLELLEAFRLVSVPVSLSLETAAIELPEETVAAQRGQANVLELPLPELRNEKSGRLDAQLVADYLGIPLKRLAGALEVGYPGVHKTPDSPRIQEKLRPVVYVLELANRAFGNAERVRKWLNRPLYELEDDSPLAVILAGEADAVETLLVNALTGIPV